MKILLITTAWIAALSMQANPPLEDILERTSRNVQALQAALPDFVCKEKQVTKSSWNGGGTQTRESLVITRQTRGGSMLVASRQVLSVKGRETLFGNQIRNQLADLIRTFAPESRGSNNYKFDRRQTFRGTSSFVVEFETRKGASAGHREGRLMGGDTGHTMKGKAWIDTNTMQVLRLELTEKGPTSPSLVGLRTVADYGSVTIDGKPYWLLTKILKTDDRSNESVAEYSDCQKFEVTSEIRPVR
jgi:hypothetical protein